MNKKQLDDKHQKILRKLLQLPENKKCFDCSEKGPFYACTTLGTFVCTTCSGIHREFQHHVKSISMASFKPEEVQLLEDMGNGRAREIWLAYWTPSDFPEPDSSDKSRVREFMKLKYERKKWCGKPNTNKTNSAATPPRSKRREEEQPRVEPIETILGRDIPPISITHNISLPISNNGSAMNRGGTPPAAARPKELFLWEETAPPAIAPARSPQIHPQPFTSPQMPVSALHAPAQGGLESVFMQQASEPAKPASTIWPPPENNTVSSQQHMNDPGAFAVFPPAASQFQQVAPHVFQQMSPQQQQQYLVMQQHLFQQQQQQQQQQWIQQQMLQQRMAQMSFATGHPSGGAGMVAINGFAFPTSGGPVPGVMQPPLSGGMPPPAGGHNPFLAAPAAPVVPTSPIPYGSSGRPGGAVPVASSSNDSLFADLSPLAQKPPGSSSAPPPSGSISRSSGIPGMAAAPSSATPGHSPFFSAAAPPHSSPVLTPAAPNPFATPTPQPPAASNGGASFNPFGSLI